MIYLMRYDTECDEAEKMDGFFQRVIDMHRQEVIPATFFCKGKTLDVREGEFAEFWAEVQSDPLFDLQDHSYTHIGACYEAGPSIEDLQADYEKSFAAHQRVLGKRPEGVSLCGTSGRDGRALKGFDATEKSRAEFEMMVNLGVKFINTRLTNKVSRAEFCNYAALGHPEIMGFPSAYSDTDWLMGHPPEEGVQRMLGHIQEHAANGWHMPMLCHDWCAWNFGPDRMLTHVARLAEAAREAGYELLTHKQAYERPALWAEKS